MLTSPLLCANSRVAARPLALVVRRLYISRLSMSDLRPTPPPGPLSGVIAAAVTPLRDGGRRIDSTSITRLAEFLSSAGVRGVLVAGTTGEGVLLTVGERMALTEAFLAAAGGRLAVAAHAGAQTTADAVRLAEHAREHGVDAVAAIGPPYFAFDDDELLAYFGAVAAAAAPVPFYLYEFRHRTGYAVPPAVVRRLAEVAPNLSGLKVSDRTMEEVRPYILPGLDVFVGAEALIPDAVAAGAVGAVSGLASVFPQAVVGILEGRQPAALASRLRARLADQPLHASLKALLVAQGVLEEASVRPPLRALTAGEHERLLSWFAELRHEDGVVARSA
jgi:dihydrodipicolinate synthase/N-acetylneuraminate lyase